jgi:hypothetical protein
MLRKFEALFFLLLLSMCYITVQPAVLLLPHHNTMLGGILLLGAVTVKRNCITTSHSFYFSSKAFPLAKSHEGVHI